MVNKKDLFVKWGHVDTLLSRAVSIGAEWMHTHVSKHAWPHVCVCNLDYVIAQECHHITKGKRLCEMSWSACFYRRKTAQALMVDSTQSKREPGSLFSQTGCMSYVYG